MHLFYCDETNIENRSGDFLIYGGLMVEATDALRLSHAIDALRARRSVPNVYQFKFNPGPPSFGHEDFIGLKREAIQLAADHGARMVVYAILHDIAVDPDTARRRGINTVCFHFHGLLNRLGGPGLALIDRFNDTGNEIDRHLREKFSIGLTGLAFGTKRMSNIIGFHYSAVGQSHLPSLVDVALGSLRFAINSHTRARTSHTETSHELLSLLSPLFWRDRAGDAVPEISFCLRPKIVKASRYQHQYDSLKQFLARAGLHLQQPAMG